MNGFRAMHYASRMTPEEARMWLGDGTKPPIIPPYIAQRALETIAAMNVEDQPPTPQQQS